MDKLEAMLLEERSRLRMERKDLREQISAAKGELKEREERLAHVEGLLGPNSCLWKMSLKRALCPTVAIFLCLTVAI